MTKKILFLLHLPPPVHGSSMVGKWIRESRLINETFDCRYINLLASNSVSDSGKISFLKIFCFIKIWFKFLFEILRNKPNICYLALTSTGAAFYRDLLFISLLRLFCVKCVYHLHNKGFAKASYSKVNRLFYRFAFKNAKVVLLSEYLYEDIKAYVNKDMVHICPNGIPEISLSESVISRDAFAGANSVPKILFLSNLIESKGVFVLLEAMALLQQKGILFQGIFVGSEGDINAEQFQEKVEALQLQKSVSYLGKKYGEEKEAIFNQVDIFAFPTLYETFGLVNIEAMQHALPVISTPEGGIRSIIEDGVNGYLIPQLPSNEGVTWNKAITEQLTKELTERLEQLINNSVLRKQMGNAGRLKYKKEFTLEIFEKRLTEILNLCAYSGPT